MKQRLLLFLTFLSLLFVTRSQAQCGNDGTLTAGNLTPPGVGLSTNLTYGAGYYVLAFVNAGANYSVTTCGTSSFDTQLTVFDDATGTLYAYNDDYCGLQSSVNFTAPTCGYVRVLLKQYFCNSSGLSTPVIMTQNTAGFRPPVITPALPDVTTCSGTPVMIGNDTAVHGGAGHHRYMWSPAMGLNDSTIARPTATLTSSKTYYFTTTDSLNCKAKDTVTVNVNPLPVQNLGPDIVQCGGTVTLNAGNAGMNYLWSNSATTQTITVSASGTYFVKVTNPVTGCIGRDTIVVTINPLPVVNLGADIVQCDGTVTLNAGNPGKSFLWSNSATTQSITVSTSGTYYVRVTNPTTGCIGRDTIVVTINSNPVVNLGADITQCGGTVTLNAGNAGMNYLWSNSATTQTTTVSASGTYYVRVTNPTTGCIGRDTIVVTINALPVVNLGADIVQCGGTVTLNAANPGKNFLWSNSATTQTITVSTSGTYYVRVTNPTTGCIGRDTIVVTINANPVVNLGADVTQCGGTVTLNAGNPGKNFLWSNSATTQSITVSTSGTYYVRVTNPATGCIGRDTVVVTINANPVVNLGADIIQCSGTVTLNAGNAGMNYLWSNASTAQTLTVSASGTYYVRVTNPATGCIGRDTIVVTINPLPVVNLGADITQCGGTATLNAGNAGMNYLWSNGTTAQTLTVNTTGMYYIAVTNPSTGCVGRDTINVTINSIPVVNLGADITQCGGTATLDAGNAGMTYMWNDGSTMQTLTATASATYYVAVTNSSTGCTGRDTINVTINAIPVVNLGADITQCSGTATLDAGNAGMNYMWSDGSTNEMLTVAASGTYYVAVTNPATGCTGYDTIMVTINPLPTVSLGMDTTQCGGTVTLDAGNTGMNYMWNDGSTDETFNATASGTYYVTVTNPATGCMNSDTIMVTINPIPVVDLGMDVMQCGGSVTLDAGDAAPYTYLWNDGSTDQTLSVTTSGTYYVTVTSLQMCAASDTISIAINAIPVVNLGNDTTFCGSSITLDAGNPSAFAYEWNDGSVNETLTATASGMYYVTVTTTQMCVASDSINVTINAIPALNLGADITQCGGTVILDAGSGDGSYMWSDGSNAQTLTVSASGEYTVEVTNMDGNCPVSDSINVTINALPGVSVLGLITCTDYAPVTLGSGSPAGGVYSGPGISGGMFDPSVTGMGNFTLTYTYMDSTGCSNSDTATINVNVCTGVEEHNTVQDVTIYPNPANDMVNIEYTNASFSELTISIMSLEGKEVYSVNDKNITSAYRKTINTQGLAKGIYYIRLVAGTNVEVRKLVIQ